MISTHDLLTKIENGEETFKELELSLKEIAAHFLSATQSDESLGWFLLKELEKHYGTHLLKNDLGSFQEFFKIASLFDRDKNSINRFFDSALGLYGPASEVKLVQIFEEKQNKVDYQSMRIRGSFEYSHTQTHYSILMDLFNYLSPKKGERFIDIGSGFGRVGLFIGLCFPDLEYLGFELVAGRVDCSNEVKLRNRFENIEFQTQDLLEPNFEIPDGDYYFLYDPLEKEELKNFYKKLQSRPGHKVIAFGGYDDFILEYLDSCPWLTQIKRFQDDYFSLSGAIYESKSLI